MDIALGARQERHLMRQRGAGARPIQGNFGFVFKAGPLQISTQSPIQDAPKAIVETSETRRETILPSSINQPELPANAIERLAAQEEPLPEPEPAKPKRKAPKKRKALFTKKKPSTTRPTRSAIDKKNHGHGHEVSSEETAATVVPEKTTIAIANVKKPRLKGPSDVMQVEDDFIFRRRRSEKEANVASSQPEPAQDSQPIDSRKRNLKRNATAIEELQDLPIIPEPEHDHSPAETLPQIKKVKTVTDIVLDRAHAEGIGKEKKTKAKTSSKRKREMESLDINEEAVGPAIPQVEPSPDTKPTKRERKANQKRDMKPIPPEDPKAVADVEEYMQAEKATVLVKKPAVKASRTRPAKAEKVTTSRPEIAEAGKEAAEDVLVEKNSAPVKKTTKTRRGRKVGDESPIEVPAGEVIQDRIEEATTSKRKPATRIRRTKAVELSPETLSIETEQDLAQHSAAPVKKQASRALRGEKGSEKGSIHDVPAMKDPKDLMTSVQPVESESKTKAAPLPRARKGRKIAQTHPETPVPVQEEDLTKKTSSRERVPLAEQDANTSSPQKLSLLEKSATSAELDDFAEELSKSKRARTTKAVTRAPRKATVRNEHTPEEETADRSTIRENIPCVPKTVVVDPAERDRRTSATKDKTSSDDLIKAKTASAPKKSALPKERAEKTTTHTLPTANKDEDDDMDAGLFAPMSKLATSSGLSSARAARKAPVKKAQNYDQQRLKAITAQDEDVDLSDVFDGIAVIAASSLKG
ncbi:hypothetical protein BDV97DRAFT_83904 [Delphinella strobiligena]|nr:hypothetical protein BDV97DRAFT_83904 [Delphinella strobiligena]